MSNTYLLTRASTGKQELSPEQQIELMTRSATALGLSDLVPLNEALGTSGRKTEFHERVMGSWILRNIRKDDTLMVTKADRLGRTLKDIWPVVEKLCTRGVRIVILDFFHGQPLDITTAVGRFVIQLLIASAELHGSLISETVRNAMQFRKRTNRPCNGQVPWGRRLVIRDARGEVVQGAKMVKDMAGKRRMAVDAGGVCIPNAKVFYEWDEVQLQNCADVAQLSFKIGFTNAIAVFRNANRLDQRGKPFGLRSGRKSTFNAFVQCRKWFLNAGLAGELPEPWNDVAKKLVPPDWGVIKPNPRLEQARAALAKKRALTKSDGGEEDRSSWSASDWQAWWQSHGADESLPV